MSTVVATVFVAAGCTGLPGRPTQVKQLDAEISAMPGVELFSASYSNNITHGSVLDLSIRMLAATEGQVTAVARRIAEIKGDYFDGYDQSAEFTVGKTVTLTRGERLDPDRLGTDTRLIRQLGGALPGADINWFRDSGSSIDIRDAPPVAHSLAAARAVLGDEPTRVEVMPAGDEPMWRVDFPFSAERERQISGRLATLPVSVAALTIERGQLSYMSVGVRDAASAYADIAAVIEAVGPTPEHPLYLWWHLPDTSAGSVHVAGCEYAGTAGERDPENPEALDLQRRVRAEFDGCR
ncbi:hypothetical protein [Nocardia cyriacigeorgica]|uniref:hypothetical protein n=1 Tax=Nocardia cyriacigeorgica TaxID=135487 RepID=UPI0011B08FA9|nr:hypothetical protein [Nocardia cyriacigeorgica]MBF6324461.1 hypothetical protein [Nocardia cyriacigeorgica]